MTLIPYKASHWVVGFVGIFIILISLGNLILEPLDLNFSIWAFLIGSILLVLAILKKVYDKKHGIDYYYRIKNKK